MSQVILNASAHHQAFNAYHLHPHKWPANPPFVADQIRSAADRKGIDLLGKKYQKW